MKEAKKQCSKCGEYKTTRANNIVKHEQSCTGVVKPKTNKRTVCDYCERVFANPGTRASHEKYQCKRNPNVVENVNRLNGYRRKIDSTGAWNKGKTKETDTRLIPSAEMLENIRKFSKSKNFKHTTESKENLSRIAKNRGFGGVTKSRRIVYNNKHLGSTYELLVAKELDLYGIRWDVCKRFKYIDPNGKTRTYTPDIYLLDYDVYLDPKNDFLIDNINPALGFSDKTKINLVQKQNNITVIILNKKELNWNTIYNKIIACKP